MSDFIAVLDRAELADGDSRAVQIRGQSVLICRSGEQFYAIANRCTHQQRELEGGRVRGHFIACPVHGVRFDLRSGKPLGSLTQVAVTVYPLRLVDGRIEVAVPAQQVAPQLIATD
jgi:3-phenylpropionate/trans-cinnamate dioxygenase ferredoxin subunit